MTFEEYKFSVLADLYRITGNARLRSLLYHLLLGEGYKFNFWMRTCRYAHSSVPLRFALYPIARLMLRKYTYKYGISISYTTDIEAGFYIGHFGGIIVSSFARIGKNCNISQGVTIGQANRGKNKGAATIGENVYIGPGAKIVGAVKVGNNVAIGANCVVTKDVPDNAVVAGVPGKVISYKGSEDYVCNTDYEQHLSEAQHWGRNKAISRTSAPQSLESVAGR